MDSPNLNSAGQSLENVNYVASSSVILNPAFEHSEFSGKSQLHTQQKSDIRRAHSGKQVISIESTGNILS